MFHVVGLAIDQAAQMQNHTLRLISLLSKCGDGVLESSKLLLIAFSLTLKLFSDFLLKNESLKGIITLFLRARETNCEARSIILLLVNKSSKTTILTLMILNLDLEVLSLLSKLLRKSLKFEKLGER
jgi:hypothetical protein